MTIKVPLLFDSTFEFVMNEDGVCGDLKIEAIYILSRAYQLSESQLEEVKKIESSSEMFFVMIAANQKLKFQRDIEINLNNSPEILGEILDYLGQDLSQKSFDLNFKLNHILFIIINSNHQHHESLPPLLLNHLYLFVLESK